MHESERDQTKVEIALAKIAQHFRSPGGSADSVGNASISSPEIHAEIVSLANRLLERTSQPAPSDLRAGVQAAAAHRKPQVQLWRENALRFSRAVIAILRDCADENTAALEALRCLDSYRSKTIDRRGM